VSKQQTAGNEKGQHAKPSRRRWRGAAIATTAVVLMAAGYATANAATSGDQSVLSTTGVAAVVDAADAFLDTLSDEQQAEVLLDFSQENAIAWSDQPCGATCRPGIELGDLSDEQLAAAEQVLTAAMGTGEGAGFDQASQILAADDLLATGVTGQASGAATPSSGASAEPSGAASAGPSAGASAEPSGAASGGPSGGASSDASATPYLDLSEAASPAPSGSAAPAGTASAKPGASGTASAGPPAGATSEPSASAPGSATPTPTSSSSADAGYGSGLYFLAFLGTPAETGTWQLHFGGVHLAVNITYVDGGVTSASPFFAGAEPASFTADGTAYEPLAGMRTAALALTSSLSETQVDEARLGESSSEVLLGPDEDGQFPEAKEGIAVSELSTDQQELVLAAIKPWVEVADDDTAQQLLAAYEADLDETYIAYSGGQDLDAPGDYVRIDGPDVWIEFLCQQGVVDPEQATYQGVYRDHSRDYGGGFTF